MNQTRRHLLKSVAAVTAAAAVIPPSFPSAALSQGAQAPAEEDYFDGTAIDHGVEYRRTNMALIPQEFRPPITTEITDPQPGRIVIDTREHFLYLTRADGTSIRYAVGVGREGFQWFGSAQVVLVSARTSPARSVRPSASSRSRNGSKPASDVTLDPWNSSFRRGSNVTRRTAPLSSPATPSISSPVDATYSLEGYPKSGLSGPHLVSASGKCGLRSRI